MASRWRHWDAGCHDSIQTVSKYQSLQHSSEGLSNGHYSSDEELVAVPVPGAGRGRKRPPAASIRLPKNLAYPEPEKKVAHQTFRLWEMQERTNYPSCSASPNCPLASQFEDDWRIQETKQMLCRVGVGRGRGRSKAEVLGKAPGRETDNGFTFSGSSGDFRAYTKQSALKQLPSHDVNRNDNAKERESKTKTLSSSLTSGLLATKRLWTPDPKKRWKKDKIAHPDNVEEWPDLSSKGSPSRGKKSPRKRKGKGDMSPPGPGASPDVRSSPKTDDQKTLEKQHGRQSKDGGKEKEVIKPAPDLSLEAVDAVLDAEDWIRLDNLPPGVQSQEVYGILEPFGAIVECHVHRHGDHSSAVVRLADSEVCEWCVSCLNETESPFPGWEGPLFCSHVRNGDSEVQS
ncbi:uncharacterized protein LOC118428413 isoform X2 [Branchiostoma floridae]|uniref:Uncharacterized protein LOC118428413 isoform X2 n=1 Tax=Branchiostoma floridae TaxID=7739 RepID=A0A9J7N931_BRAFL|nr:uncharacterized protein LOC118428413 isoform X2 [Branchiostoma floridae]XP_035694356.1 uncharacterized protein LOC118428413 isoform X2 [Branchiostoma floridae]XP_035694357.1 uncharacterized protein LOC118428413 isoform X2 [Branchiostoma floridae]